MFGKKVRIEMSAREREAWQVLCGVTFRKQSPVTRDPGVALLRTLYLYCVSYFR